MKNIVLWGHDLSDYQAMFALTSLDLTQNIVEYGSGPTIFNAEMHKIGHRVVSIDPQFGSSQTEVKLYFDKDFETAQKEMQHCKSQFNDSKYGSLDAFLKHRRAGMHLFYEDYVLGYTEGRYIDAKLADLPFDNFQFKIAVSSHCFFGNRGNEDLAFHTSEIRALARIAEEVRIFPLTDPMGNISEVLGPLLLHLQQEKLGVELREVPYELQSNRSALLRVWAQSCDVA